MVREALQSQTLWLPPPVVTEISSAPTKSALLDMLLAHAPMLGLAEGFWERAGANRRLILLKGFKAKLVDTLVAQCCIDAGVPLIARDGNFRHFAQWCGLRLAL